MRLTGVWVHSQETRAMVIVAIRFTYSCSQETLSELAMDFATNVRPNVEGLVWKIYLNDPDRRRSAGLYLFRDVECANAYVNGSYVQGLSRAPIVCDISIETFQTMQEPSIVSGGPILERDPSLVQELARCAALG